MSEKKCLVSYGEGRKVYEISHLFCALILLLVIVTENLIHALIMFKRTGIILSHKDYNLFPVYLNFFNPVL